MAKYQEKPTVVTAYVIVSIGAVDDNGDYVPDADGNLTAQAGDKGAAGTIPFAFPAATLEAANIGDYVVIAADGTQSVVPSVTFTDTYTAI